MPGARQHITPVFHLTQFAGHHPKDCVWVYDRKEGSARPVAPNSAGFERHFYSVKRDDGSWDTQLDDWITGVEATAHPIYLELLAGIVPTDDAQAKADFAVYLSTIYARTKAMRRFAAETYASLIQMTNHATAAHPDVFESHIRLLEQDRGKPIDPKLKEEVRQAMLDPSDWIIEIPKERTIASLKFIDKLTDIFFSMHWSLVAPEKGFFITSDNPLIRRVEPRTRHPIHGDHGFRNRTAQVTFALSPKLVLILTWQKHLPRRWVVSRETVNELNHDLAAHAERFLYAHLDHKHIAKLSKKFGEKQPRGVQGLGDGHFAEIRVKR